METQKKYAAMGAFIIITIVILVVMIGLLQSVMPPIVNYPGKNIVDAALSAIKAFLFWVP